MKLCFLLSKSYNQLTFHVLIFPLNFILISFQWSSRGGYEGRERARGAHRQKQSKHMRIWIKPNMSRNWIFLVVPTILIPINVENFWSIRCFLLHEWMANFFIYLVYLFISSKLLKFAFILSYEFNLTVITLHLESKILTIGFPFLLPFYLLGIQLW